MLYFFQLEMSRNIVKFPFRIVLIFHQLIYNTNIGCNFYFLKALCQAQY